MSNNQMTLGQKLKSYKRTPFSFLVMLFVLLSAVITFAVLIFLIAYVLINGVPYLKPSLFSFTYTSENASMMPALINTVIMTLLSLAIAVPFGIFSAIFLVEYAGRGNKFVEVIRLTTETLQGIPSIVYGLFGMLFFVSTCGWGFSILAGSIHIINHGASADYEKYGRSIKGSAGLLQRRKFRTGCGETSHGFSHCTSVCRSGDSCRSDSCSRTNRWRDSSAYLYSGNIYQDSKQCDGFRKNSGGTYV